MDTLKLSQYAFEKEAILFFLYKELCNNYQERDGPKLEGPQCDKTINELCPSFSCELRTLLECQIASSTRIISYTSIQYLKC